MRSALCLILLSALVSGGSGCGEKKLSGSEIFVKEHGAELMKFREQLGKIMSAAADAPPLESDGFTGEVTLDLNEYHSTSPTSGNTRVWQLSQLQGGYKTTEVSLGGVTHDFKRLDEWTSKKRKSSPSVSEMKRFLKLEYIILLHVLEGQQAEQAGDKSFTAGHLKAEARLYRLTDAAMLGGVRFGASSSDRVGLHGAAAQNEGLDRKISLNADLSVRGHKALGTALKAALPDIQLDGRYIDY